MNKKFGYRSRLDFYRVSVSKMNELLSDKRYNYEVTSENFIKLVNEGKTSEVSGRRAVVESDIHEVALFRMNGTYPVCYYCLLDDREGEERVYLSKKFGPVTGYKAFCNLKRFCHDIPETNGYDDAEISASQFMYKNRKKIGTFKNSICFDRNSAFTASMLEWFADFTNDLGPGVVEDGEVGFTQNVMADDENFVPILGEDGLPASHRFKLAPVPDGVVKYCKKWLKKKESAKKGSMERLVAKAYLNFAPGALQNHCCWYRALIVGMSNRYMLSLGMKFVEKFGRNCLEYGHCDSWAIDLDKAPRDEVMKIMGPLIGEKVGEFKIEHEGACSLSSTAYQWDGCCPTWNGVSKVRLERFEEIYGHQFHINNREDEALLDAIPLDYSRHKFNASRMVIERQ